MAASENDAGTKPLREKLGRVRDAAGFRLIGYVVMPEHVHLLISEPREGTPSTVLQKLKLGVARKLRKRKRDCAGQLRLPFAAPRGPLRAFWQARSYDFNVYSRGKKPPRRPRELTPNPCRHQHRSAGILPATACSKVAVEKSRRDVEDFSPARSAGNGAANSD
jgi:REP element-mobilizing transposase RayT